ncbi:MAG: hypothetical protein Tsb002_27560 [Wenzhouxiangellaceae bacterium]
MNFQIKKQYLKVYFTLLLSVAVFFTVLFSTYALMHLDRIAPDEELMIVYGRDSCAHTTLLRNKLEQNQIEYTYANIDKPLIDIEMWIKLGVLSGRTAAARLPVVEYQGEIVERPDRSELVARYVSKNAQMQTNE